MTDHPFARDELLRYARHLALPHMGMEGQIRLREARVLCVGAGGLGSPVALYLAAAGVGTLGLVDHDEVDVSNLQRQILHGTSDVGRPKLASARERLADLNPHVEVETHAERLTSANALEVLEGYDVVVDGTDNFPTRYLVNDACVLLGIPTVYGSIFRWEGQASVFADGDGPCYRCLFREPPPPGLVPNCAEGGVLGVLPGIIGSLQAMETLKLLMGVGSTLSGRLLIFDALEMSWREVALRRNPDCPVCGDEPTQTELIDYERFCGVGAPGSGAQVGDDGASSEVEEITPGELHELLEGDEAPFLLDVREPWEWSVSNLEARGARLIPLDELPDRLSEVPTGRPVVAYCRSGGRSARAAALLSGVRGAPVRSLAGGITAWAREVDPELAVV